MYNSFIGTAGSYIDSGRYYRGYLRSKVPDIHRIIGSIFSWSIKSWSIKRVGVIIGSCKMRLIEIPGSSDGPSSSRPWTTTIDLTRIFQNSSPGNDEIGTITDMETGTIIWPSEMMLIETCIWNLCKVDIDILNVGTRSQCKNEGCFGPNGKNRHQHLKVVTITFRLPHPSPTSM